MSQYQEELEKLLTNEEQKQAYLFDDHCVVLAGPGSGKTATLTLKLLRLLELNIRPPQGLACLTFNNEAVKEFRSRLPISDTRVDSVEKQIRRALYWAKAIFFNGNVFL